MNKGLSVLLTLLGGCLGWFIGEINGLFYALVAFVIVDYITGIIAAIINKKLASNIGFKGICKKVMLFALVGIGNVIDLNLIGNGNTFRTAILIFYIGNEGISILENCTVAGLPVPEKLKNILEQIKKKGDD